MTGALDGIKVMDFSRLLPFEYCTMMLADLGADVLKVEEPKKGDYMRWLPPKNKNEGYIFLLANRNKKSMTLNFNAEKGREIVCQLVGKYDVLFESFRPGVMDGFGLGYKDLRKINPRLVYCSSTGYGQTGPYKDKAGHDANYIAVAGILGVTGRHTGAPVIPGIPIADMSIGIFSAYSILAGIMARDRTGKGQHIDVSMTDCMVSYNTIPLAHHFAGQEYGMGKSSDSLEITGHALWYNCFETRDGKHLFLGNLEKKFWINLCKAISREDFVDFEFATGKKRDEIMAEMRNIFLTKTREEWLKIMEGKDFCASPVNSLEEVISDPQVKARQMILDVDHPVEGTIKQIGFPYKFSETPGEIKMPPPVLGQHTNEVLADFGYTKDDIRDLEEKGII